jgi:hypothetical protein
VAEEAEEAGQFRDEEFGLGWLLRLRLKSLSCGMRVVKLTFIPPEKTFMCFDV